MQSVRIRPQCRERGASRGKVIGVVVVLGGLAAVAVAMSLSGPSERGPYDSNWHYDLATGNLLPGTQFTAATPPDLTNQPVAHVFACGDCTGERFINYIERFSPEALDARKQLDRDDNIPTAELTRLQGVVASGSEVAQVTEGDTADAVAWVRRDTAEGQEIIASEKERCAGSPYTPCTPGMAGL